MCGAEIEIDDRLVELDYGEWDGRPLDEIRPTRVSRWMSDPTFAPPGGESLVAVTARVASFCGDRLGADDRVIAVSHVSPIKAAVAWAFGVDERATLRMYLGLASITTDRRPCRRRRLPVVVQRPCPPEDAERRYSTASGIERRAGIGCAPSASTMKRPSPGPFGHRHAQRFEQRVVFLGGTAARGEVVADDQRVRARDEPHALQLAEHDVRVRRPAGATRREG